MMIWKYLCLFCKQAFYSCLNKANIIVYQIVLTYTNLNFLTEKKAQIFFCLNFRTIEYEYVSCVRLKDHSFFRLKRLYANLYAKRTTSSPITPLNKVEYKLKYLHEQQQSTSTSYIHLGTSYISIIWWMGLEIEAMRTFFIWYQIRYITYELFELTLSAVHGHTKRRSSLNDDGAQIAHKTKLSDSIVIQATSIGAVSTFSSLFSSVHLCDVGMRMRFQCNLWLCQAVCA